MAMLGIGEAVVGPALPEGFSSQLFNCPEGSDFAKSQEVGMCVGSAYDPVYSQAGAGARRIYYNLDGSVAGVDMPPVVGKTLIPGISDTYVYAAVGILFLMLMRGRR